MLVTQYDNFISRKPSNKERWMNKLIEILCFFLDITMVNAYPNSHWYVYIWYELVNKPSWDPNKLLALNSALSPSLAYVCNAVTQSIRDIH